MAVKAGLKNRKSINRVRQSRMNVRKSMVNRKRQQRIVHSFKRTVWLGQYKTDVSGGALATAFSFQFSLLPNVAEYKALYDQYKIDGIAFRVIPKTQSFQGGTSGTTDGLGYSQVITAIDRDDAAAPVQKDNLLQYSTAKVTQADAIHTRYFKPSVLNNVFINAVTTGTSPVSPKWLSTQYDTVQHYGIKIWIDPPAVPVGALSSKAYDLYAVYYFRCKNTK